MPVKLDCPHCHQPLSVPKKKTGTHVQCPRCQRLLWVPDHRSHSTASDPEQSSAAGFDVDVPMADAVPSTSDASPTAPPAFRAGPAPLWNSAPSAVPSPPPPPSPGGAIPLPGQTGGPTLPPPGPVGFGPNPAGQSGPPGAGPGIGSSGPGGIVQPIPPNPPALSRPSGVSEPRMRLPAAPPPAGAETTPAVRGAIAVPLPAAPLRPQKRVARLIPAEAAAITIQPGPDGKLPELRLAEIEKPDASEAKSGLNPLVLILLLCFSVAMSMAVVLWDTSPENEEGAQRKSDARAYIQANYFSSMDRTGELEPYQKYLREAAAAHERHDAKTERAMYRRVLGLLRAERGPFQRGLTGSRSNDRALEERIAILLSDD